MSAAVGVLLAVTLTFVALCVVAPLIEMLFRQSPRDHLERERRGE